MLQWPPLAYWISMRFIPGATNRWRACHHLSKVRSLGMELLSEKRERRESLPVSVNSLSRQFRDLSDDELRTVAIDIVAIAK